MNKIFLLFLFFSSLCYSQKRKIDAENIFLNTQFKEIKSTAKIPKIIKALKDILNAKEKPFIANPTEKFNATDMVEKTNLPWRRFILAGRGNKYEFIYYEVGGIAYHTSLILFDRNKNILYPIFAFVTLKKKNTITELKQIVKQEIPLKNIRDILKKRKYKSSNFSMPLIIKYDISQIEKGVF